ncbi:hypothetical protein ABZ215_30185 [Amycolatopsis sp. NPDC006131]|uniref:hypothetical protein n=1 Tax=Amycolatopsis sp. NPDC006131 TaxID=3156731 RepID=UPI0033ADCD50
MARPWSRRDGREFARHAGTAEPDVVVPSTISAGGRTMATVRSFVAGQLRRGAGDGAHVRISASFLIKPEPARPPERRGAAAGDIARRFLVPMLAPSAA